METDKLPALRGAAAAACGTTDKAERPTKHATTAIRRVMQNRNNAGSLMYEIDELSEFHDVL